jgi:L-cysteine desulfidase
MLKCRWLRALPIFVVVWFSLAASNARAQSITVPALSNVGSGLQGSSNAATLSRTRVAEVGRGVPRVTAAVV